MVWEIPDQGGRGSNCWSEASRNASKDIFSFLVGGVSEIMMLLCQLSYAIKNELKASSSDEISLTWGVFIDFYFSRLTWTVLPVSGVVPSNVRTISNCLLEISRAVTSHRGESESIL